MLLNDTACDRRFSCAELAYKIELFMLQHPYTDVSGRKQKQTEANSKHQEASSLHLRTTDLLHVEILSSFILTWS